MQQAYHVPVLLHEVIEGLQIVPSGVYVDCTFGGGGHSKKILEKLNRTGKLVVFDQDEDARKNVPDDPRILFVPHNFRHLQRFLRFHKIFSVNGILADLGVSSHQINEAERGFSTRFDASMDMRMNRNDSKTAAQVVQTYSEEMLQKIFEKYGEVSNSKTLAQKIVEARRLQPIETIKEFKNAIFPVVKGNPQKYLAQVFQALRIEVNDELNVLKELLLQSVNVLASGGRIAVITFHSLEDRLVKNFFKNGNFEPEQQKDIFGNPVKSELKVITKKPVIPSKEEQLQNPRSRSSKLRIAEKI
ncbi:16S rRNA (cytosine(1402)-N(4))-methyltransferase RsmH [Hanamia caeni]|jgi:16S rRNA (cytosine1402-N4)-methyltransferase|uniref:Ribosomal RNA small subunit methyltransferase H n=1 Tax=Hanamia caeni TaxID=2294116 RepID=A0A3M9N2W2_9BACT|nr:16S rRNA (cytosine(1402)-N(4))-methyltransferase RsmH [Hanamia caeni]RNI32089.1 16S rRNA (cytosine(1402)-N(4))-methyltransferase RsmH [Hanamia caeni]